jgi:hypothetical protein
MDDEDELTEETLDMADVGRFFVEEGGASRSIFCARNCSSNSRRDGVDATEPAGEAVGIVREGTEA